jgi:hypothetical protein
MTVFVTILVTSVVVSVRRSLADYPPCSTPDKLARTGGATWAPDNLYFDHTDRKDEGGSGAAFISFVSVFARAISVG